MISMIKLPFKFYYESYGDEKGNKSPFSQNIILKSGKETLVEDKARVALVLVDVWGRGDDSDLESASSTTKNISRFLKKCRDHDITVIHSPNFPIVNQYEQYHYLRDKVKEDFSKEKLESPEYMNWPPPEGSLYRRSIDLQKQYETPIRGFSDFSINKCVEPLSCEYVAQSYEELRYVLWKEKNDIVLFVGGSLRQCLLHRPISINSLRGVYSNSNGLYSHFYYVKNFVCVLEDCLYNIGSSDYSEDVSKGVMLETLGWNLTNISNSKEIVFFDKKE